MESGLPIGTMLSTDCGTTVTVLRALGKGGQECVYEADYGADRNALKWHRTAGMGDPPAEFRKDLKDNIRCKSPPPALFSETNRNIFNMYFTARLYQNHF